MNDPDDHDLLLRMSEKVDKIHDEVIGTEAFPGLRLRVDGLESWRDKSTGWISALKWMWGGIIALAGALGWHVHVHK